MRAELCDRMRFYDRAKRSAPSYAAMVLRSAGIRWLQRERAPCSEPLNEEQIDSRPGPEAQALAALSLSGLPAQQQEALRMKVWQNATVREIGQRLGVSRSTAHRLYKQAVKTMSETVN